MTTPPPDTSWAKTERVDGKPSQDIPLASVRVGLSEIVLLITMLGSLLTAVFGQDWGVGVHAQQIAEKGVILLPVALGLFRAIKHHGVANANAVVVAQQIAQQTLNTYQQAKHAAQATPTAQVTASVDPPATVAVPASLDAQPASSTL